MLAEKFNLSPSYLSRFIKNQTGFNFLDYLNSVRMQAAKQMLDTGAKIDEVAVNTGYTNDITFRRMFKKFEGITPGQYRD